MIFVINMGIDFFSLKLRSSGHTAVVRELGGKGADVNKADGTGWTSLYWATQEGRKLVVRILIV